MSSFSELIFIFFFVSILISSSSLFIFIDAISKSFKSSPEQSDNVYYVSSPGALTELSLVVNKFLKYNFDYLIFDSVSNLIVYNKIPVIHKFLRSLVNNIKKTKTKALFFIVESQENKDLISQCNLFFDNVVQCCEE